MKTCTKCGGLKSFDRYYRNHTRPDGLTAQCRDCIAKSTRARREADPDAFRLPERARQRRYYAADPEKFRAEMRRRRHEDPERARAIQRRSDARVRQAVFDRYGWTCACCGATENLTIDHINGDGKEHRAADGLGKGSHKFYRWLVANNFPEGFQTLCGVCNRSKFTGERCRLHIAEGSQR